MHSLDVFVLYRHGLILTAPAGHGTRRCRGRFEIAGKVVAHWRYASLGLEILLERGKKVVGRVAANENPRTGRCTDPMQTLF